MKLKWLSYLINTLAILLIAASLFVLLAVVLTPSGQVPQVMGFSVLRVLTGSMKPEIPEDSMLLIQKADAASLHPHPSAPVGRIHLPPTGGRLFVPPDPSGLCYCAM